MGITPSELGTMPPPSALQHINVIGDGDPPATKVHYTALDSTNIVDPPIARFPTLRASCAILLGAGLPPFLAKLVSIIEVGEFIEMAELQPKILDPTRILFSDEPGPPKIQKWCKLVTKSLNGHSALPCTWQFFEIPGQVTRYAQLPHLDNSNSHAI